jgi:hypothetical protein
VGRTEAERSPWRGRRFVFAAASAVSFAAIALGGALPPDASGQANPRREGAGNNVTPLQATRPTAANSGTNNSAGAELNSFRTAGAERRSSMGNGSTRSERGPMTPGVPSLLAPAVSLTHPFSASMLTNSSSALSPLIHPPGVAFHLATVPGLIPTVTTVPIHFAAPTTSARPLSAQR